MSYLFISKRDTMDGKRLNIAEMNLMLYGRMDPDYPSRMSPEQRMQLLNAVRADTPDTDALKGQVMVYGTIGELEKSEGLEEFFVNGGAPEHISGEDYGELIADAPNPPQYFHPGI